MTLIVGSDPAACVVRITRGCDTAFTFQRVDEHGAGVPIAAEVYLLVDLSKAAPTKVPCVVTSDTAAVLFPAAVCDQVKNTTTWQLVRADNLKTPLLVGTFDRIDGST